MVRPIYCKCVHADAYWSAWQFLHLGVSSFKSEYNDTCRKYARSMAKETCYYQTNADYVHQLRAPNVCSKLNPRNTMKHKEYGTLEN